MVAELNKNMGSQVSTNKSPTPTNQRIGILSFEIANVMSKTVYLHKSLTESSITALKSEISTSHGVQTLVSSDQNRLFELVLAEKLDDLSRIAAVVSRLGKRCSEPALQGFEHVYADIIGGSIEVSKLGFLVKDMDAMAKRLEKLANSTSSLYSEMEVLSELEEGSRKFQNNQHEESKRAFEQKVTWQRQDVRHLREASLWNQTYDKVVELLARTVCTVYARICTVFGETKEESLGLKRCLSKRRSDHLGSFRPDDFGFPCGTSPGRLFMECLSLSSSVYEDDERTSQISVSTSMRYGSNKSQSRGPKRSNLSRYAPPSTVGGSALALHYANVIIVIEKLLKYPHLVGEEARDDLYRMLPSSLRTGLRAGLGPEARRPAIYDGPLAHEWREALGKVLAWLGPMAQNTIRWQSERNNFEQRTQIVARTNVLLVQTLYFADRAKTESAICRLLVGLNYICRYEHQRNALLDCASSFDFEDCLEWQLQCRASLID